MQIIDERLVLIKLRAQDKHRSWERPSHRWDEFGNPNALAAIFYLKFPGLPTRKKQ